jgi:hypothetical protein
MKYIFTVMALIISHFLFGQSTGYFRYDSTRLEKVGGNNELILLNGTRDSIGVLFNMGNGRTRFRTINSLGITSKVANGITKAVDTLILGDSLDRFTPIIISSSLKNGTRFNHLLLTNRDIGAYDKYPYMLTYTPSTFGIRRVYGDQYGDVDSTFYGGSASFLTQIFRDSTLSTFGAGKRSELLSGMGLESVGQYYPPRDTMVLKVGRDGQSGNVLFGQLDIGNSWGYNMNIVPETTFPLFPISAGRTSIDLSRVSDNTRRKKMTGAGISGFTTMYKSYQTGINTSTYETGNYWENMFGFRAYGDAYPLISGATKAKTLLVATVKNSYGVYVDPQYRYTNTVDNGYSFYAVGDTDLFVNKGFAYFGNNSPTRQANTEAFRYRIYNNGRYWGQDSVHGFIVDAYGMSVQIPKSIGDESTINFLQKDTAVTGIIGSYTPTSRDSRGFYIRSEGYNGATYDDTGNGFFVQIETGVNHSNITRWWRNGNMSVGHSIATLAYKPYKKLTVGGSSAFLDTVTIKNIPTGAAAGDTTNFKPALFDAKGNIYKGAWAFAGGGGGSGGITIGTTTITSGTNTKVLFNNSGVVGEYNISGSGNVAMTTSPTFTTPLLGTPTSGTLTNTTGYLWNNLANPTGTQTLAWDDAELNAWTNGSNTETFTTIDNNSLTTGTSFKWNSNSLTTGNLLSLNSTSTTLAAGNEAIDIAVSGANGTNAITATGIRSTVTNTNATSGTNVAGEFSASGATTDNIAVNVTGGSLRVRSSWTGMQPSLSVFTTILGAGNADTRTAIVSNNAAGNTLLLSNSSSAAGTGFYLGALSNDLVANNLGGTQRMRITSAGAVIIGTSTTALAWLSLPAGTTAANTAPLKFATGTSMTSAEAGAMEYTTDDLFFTISTGTARKRILMADQTAGLTSGTVPVATTNGRLTDGYIITSTQYTPTLTAVTNATSPANDGDSYYQRIGNYIIVYGTLEFTATAAATLTEIGVSLPIASAIATITDIHGDGTVVGSTIMTGVRIDGDATNDRAKLVFRSDLTGLHNVKYSFMYKII